MGEIKESWSKLLRALSVKVVRYLPFVFIAFSALFYIEMLISISNGNYTEFVNEQNVVISIVYNTPFSDSLRNYFSVSISSIIPLFILSYRMGFCSWLRYPLYFLFAQTIVNININNNNISFDAYLLCVCMLIAIIVTLIISVVLRKKYGDRVLDKNIK